MVSAQSISELKKTTSEGFKTAYAAGYGAAKYARLR